MASRMTCTTTTRGSMGWAAMVMSQLAILLHVAWAAQEMSPGHYLRLHNAARRAEGVGLEPLKWDDALAEYAQDYADQLANTCSMRHSNGPYGENLYMGSTGPMAVDDAMKMWMSEKSDYDYDTNSCRRVCGHYTQLVWRDTERVGCGYAECRVGYGIIVCSYDPPGNFQDERPYLIST